MLTAHRVADIRAAEKAAAAVIGWDELMMRAARGLADHLAANLPDQVVPVMMIGPGNNGGDALFAAKLLCDGGRNVDLCLVSPDQVHSAGLAAAIAAGATVVDSPMGYSFVVDAIFGIGARPGLQEAGSRVTRWVNWIELAEPYVVAVDVPSGIGVDDGVVSGLAVRANHTVTFGTHKIGLLAGPAAAYAGEGAATVVPIGVEPYLGAPALDAIEPHDGPKWADLVTPTVDSHKYTRGVVGISAGSPQYAGAAHLCVAGAQAGPAGMVRFHGPEKLAERVVDRAPEVVAADGLVQAWVVGPGGPDSGGPLSVALRDGVPLVIDASALGHLPESFEIDALLTPHAGELAKLLDLERGEVEADPLRHATAAAARWNATVLLKGHRTLVVSPDGRARVNLSGTSWLGTAGSGDVLAGLCGSLLAGGLSSFQAGSLAAYLHGVAGVRANPGGPIVASAIATWLPVVTADFLAGALGEVQW